MIDRGRDTSSSLVIISRKMLIGGVLAISLFSFGLGYFFGYGGTSADKVVKRVEADSKIAPSEERTVLDSSGKPTIVPPPAMPGLVPKETGPKPDRHEAPEAVQQQKPAATQPSQQLTQKPSPQIPFPQMPEQTPAQNAKAQPQQEMQKKTAPRGKEVSKKSDNDAGTTAAKSIRNGAVVAKNSDDNVSAPAPKKKSVKKEKAHKNQSSKTGKSGKQVKKHPAATKKAENAYFIQAGAFADRSKAEKLKSELSAKGFKSTITTVSSAPGKPLFRVRLGPYTTKKDADEHASRLKEKGLGSIVVTGRR